MKKKIILDSFLLLLLGALSSLSLPPFNFFFINFFSFSIFFVFLYRKINHLIDKKIFFYYGWLFGFGYFLSSLYWITISLTFDKDYSFLIPIALFFIPAFLAIFYGLITFIFYLFNLKSLMSNFFLFSLLFGMMEFLRGNILTGFPWNLIIYSLSNNLNFISFISVIGTYSFNLILISFFSSPAIYILSKSKKDIFICIILLMTPMIFLYYGSLYKNKFLANELEENPYTIRIIGSNISLDRFYNKSKTENVLKELINISSPEDKKIFFIWPEGIVPNIYQDQLDLYNDLFSKNFNNNHFIGLGIKSRSIDKNNFKYFNSFSVFDYKLNLIKDYKKINLVPFGEFLPLEKLLSIIGFKTLTHNIGSFEKGDSRQIIEVGKNFEKFKFLPLICYEIIYSGNLTKNYNFDFIINISEDGWFGKSIGPKQHFTHSIFRAIESGKYVIRSANNGRAAIINPLGEIEKKIDYGSDGYLDFEKRRNIDPTFFSKYGNKIFIIFILLYIFLIFSFNRIKNE